MKKVQNFVKKIIGKLPDYEKLSLELKKNFSSFKNNIFRRAGRDWKLCGS